MSPKQRSVVVIIVLALAVALLWWWRGRSHLPAAGTEKPVANEPAASSTPAGVPNTASSSSANEPAAKSVAPPPTQKPSPQLWRTLETLNHNEIEFYGRAMDQFGKGVPAAAVEGVVIVNTGTRGGEMLRKTATDAQGYFQFGGFKGQDLGIAISKEGYEYRRHNSSFSYTYFEADHKRHIPDPKNPVIFVLWKKQGAEPLVHYEQVWRFPVNAGPIKIDLLKGKIGEAQGDLIVNISRTPLRMRYGASGFEWKAAVDVVGGGLVRAGQRDYYNEAPAVGYAPRFEYVQVAQSVEDAQEGGIKWTWSREVADVFYITSRDGKNYARVALRLKPNSDRNEGDNEALVAAEVWLNPNGSRNLEFDRTKAIKPVP